MPSAQPVGEPVPADGRLPERALAGLSEEPLGVYVHVPFCRVRCGYCDFNTYTVPELGGHGATVDTYAEAALAELALAGRVLSTSEEASRVGTAGVPAISTVFVGGGTPTRSEEHTSELQSR